MLPEGFLAINDLNEIQLSCIDLIFNTNHNMIVSAPTVTYFYVRDQEKR